MAGAIGQPLHSYFDLDSLGRDRKFCDERRNQAGGCLKRVRQLFAPRCIAWLLAVVQPDLKRITVVVFADAGKQVGVARGAFAGFVKKWTGPHELETPGGCQNNPRRIAPTKANAVKTQNICKLQIAAAIADPVVLICDVLGERSDKNSVVVDLLLSDLIDLPTGFWDRWDGRSRCSSATNAIFAPR
jgi:hypothetical protein